MLWRGRKKTNIIYAWGADIDAHITSVIIAKLGPFRMKLCGCPSSIYRKTFHDFRSGNV